MRVANAVYQKVLRPVWNTVHRSVARSVSRFELQYRPRFLSTWHGRRLKLVAGRDATQSGGVVAVVPYYGNRLLLDSFKSHYRALGIDQFVFLDLSRAKDLSDLVKGDTDVAVWAPSTTARFEPALHWLNFLRRRYCMGRWCLSVDPHDFFVFYRSETRSIKDLIDFLESEARRQLYAIVVDLYGDKPATALEQGAEHPFSKLCYFDPVGYRTNMQGRFGVTVTRGGLQRRALFHKNPQRSPPLNRVPLVKINQQSLYLAGTRIATPNYMNAAHSRWHTSPTGCLLRVALLDDEDVLDIAMQGEKYTLVRERASSAYDSHSELKERKLAHPKSVKYTATQDLVHWGLLSPGQWF